MRSVLVTSVPLNKHTRATVRRNAILLFYFHYTRVGGICTPEHHTDKVGGKEKKTAGSKDSTNCILRPLSQTVE